MFDNSFWFAVLFVGGVILSFYLAVLQPMGY